VIPDANEAKKRAAVENMKRAYERAQTVATAEDKRRQAEKKLELSETAKILKLQMDLKNAQQTSQVETDRQFRGFLDQTVSLLGNRDKEEQDKRNELRTSYAKELREQMQEQRDANIRRFNEMDERERKLNVGGLAAYEAAEATANTRAVPGFEVDKTFDKDDFKRKSSKALNLGNKLASKPTRSVTALSLAEPAQVSPDRVRNFSLGKAALERAEQKAAAEELLERQAAQQRESIRKLPTYTERASRQRSSVNYDDLAGKPGHRNDHFNPITGIDPTVVKDTTTTEGPAKKTLRQIQDERSSKQSPWSTDPHELPMPPAPKKTTFDTYRPSSKIAQTARNIVPDPSPKPMDLLSLNRMLDSQVKTSLRMGASGKKPLEFI
jgi:hypothetical protein